VGQQPVRHVLVVNQHGDNRGDEAALHGMLSGISRAHGGPVRFTVIHQFADDRSARELATSSGFDVEWISLKLSPIEGLRLVLYLATRIHAVLGRVGAATIAAYRSADVVVSAPGGPYFGDIYIGHEPVHWLYVWMARIHHKPAVLYATSAGPFAKAWANPFRRFTYRCFDAVIVREEISAAHIRALFGTRRRNVEVRVTVDAALQVSVPPSPRDSALRRVVVSAIDWKYEGDAAPETRRANYDAAVTAAVAELCTGAACEVVLVPQLHGSAHRDAPYLERLASLIRDAVGNDVSVSVFDESRDMLAQRALFASADFVVAGRYHPAVFALSAGVPQVCIPYEHKATGVLQLAGLSDLVVPITEVTPQRLVDVARGVRERADDVRARSQAAAVRLADLSSQTSRTVVDLMDGAL
jgi:colanic acid/amylovoran biosynthesis protein